MKKSLLSLSIGAAIAGLTLAGAANAAVSIAGTNAAVAPAHTADTLSATDATQLDLAAGGIGHIGIIPYFSTQNGNQTLFSITNTDQTNGKAVKVRFRSAANSDDIFDFTLFLSPGDVWTANISQDPTGVSRLATSDNSCTLPAQADLNRGFVTDRLPASFTADQKAAWTREGYIEVLTMADIPPVYADGVARAPTTGATPTTANRIYTTTKHVKGVAPCDAAVLGTLLTDVVDEKGAVAAGLDTPTTGLYTNAFIINTANALQSWSSESTAVVATNAGAPARGRLVFAPQTNSNLAGGVAAAKLLTADPLLAGGYTKTGTPIGAGTLADPALITALEFDFPDLSTPYTGTGATAASGAGSPALQAARLSGSLAALSVNNDYSTLAAISSKTDFTFSQPTRRYHAAVNYVPATGSTAAAFNPIYSSPGNAGTGPADKTQVAYYTPSNTSISGALLCTTPGGTTPVVAYDRSESKLTSSTGAVVSPGTAAAGLQFCGEVSVLTINNDPTAPAGKGVLSAAVAVQNVFTGYQEGWININTPGTSSVGGAANLEGVAGGLPVLGSSYESAVGLPVAGKSTNYSWTYKHKTVLKNGL